MSESTTTKQHYFLCRTCSYPIPLGEKRHLPCERCGHENFYLAPQSARVTLALSLTALLFYFPANLFPFMTIEMYGSRHSATIWGGVVELAEAGSWPIALLVFLASLVIPLLKLVILFYLSLTAKNKKHRRFKTKLYLFVETIGRWSMLDIFLLAVLVALIKLGPWTTVRPELGSLLFALVVVFTMIASTNFSPQLLWEDDNEKL